MKAKPKENARGVKTPLPGRAIGPKPSTGQYVPPGRTRAPERTNKRLRDALGWDPRCWWL